ncbi:MAG: DUF4123 domain-containing protein [Rubrivivax sp.]|nr:MAG: DUF4123 domain-containing protein [Rubrivivax sp.]
MTSANYELSAHLERIYFSGDVSMPGQSGHHLALIDVGQVSGLAQRLQRLPLPASWCLYEDTFAHNAKALSPLLIELSPEFGQALTTVGQLDELCSHLPILSVIHTPWPPAQWLRHLQTLLRIEMDGVEYLWRLADTQMLQATASVLNEEQQGMVFGPCHAWWIVSADGSLKNLACPTAPYRMPSQTLRLDAHQERRLLQATAPHALASQLRSMDMDFQTKLSHAEQSRFAMDCIAKAREEFIDEDSELVSWAWSAWQKAQIDIPQAPSH